MILCFGTFASVLNCCRQHTLQAPFIAKIINIIDSSSRYIGVDFAGDGPAINRLLSCKIDFILSDGVITKVPEQEDVIKRFENEIDPFIDEDNKAKIILTLLDIIRKDKSLDFDKRENLKKYIGFYKEQLLQQNEFVFSDFLGKILLYTICGNVSNKAGITCVKDITLDYINAISKPYVFEFQWDLDMQTLTLQFAKIFNIFNQAFTDYQIDYFILKIDPTNMMNFNWIEKCEKFIEYIRDNIYIPFSPSTTMNSGFMLTKTQQFAQTLNDYLKYLSLSMRPISDTKTYTAVPLFRDENPRWAINFANEVETYRKQLISIYEEIYNHMLFAHS